MNDLRSTFLCDISADVANPPIPVGTCPEGTRMVANIIGGTVVGPRLSGTIAQSGADWLLMRADGSMRIDVRAVITTHDGASIYATYGGRLVIPADLLAALGDPEARARLDPSQYYFRTNPVFEVAMDSPYAWLNHVVAVGVGRLTPTGVAYRMHQIL